MSTRRGRGGVGENLAGIIWLPGAVFQHPSFKEANRISRAGESDIVFSRFVCSKSLRLEATCDCCFRESVTGSR